MRDNLPNMLRAAAKEWRKENKVVATGATRYDAALEEAADAIEELSKLVDESIPKDDAEILIAEVAKPRWIPVTERLPECDLGAEVGNMKSWKGSERMGIYLPNMEMPTRCCECRLSTCHSFKERPLCDVLVKYMSYGEWEAKRLDDCPLVPVPPHGDLIDRDALRASIRESIEECHKWADEVDKDTMMYARISQSLGTFVECSLRAKAAPTILEAEEGE